MMSVWICREDMREGVGYYAGVREERGMWDAKYELKRGECGIIGVGEVFVE